MKSFLAAGVLLLVIVFVNGDPIKAHREKLVTMTKKELMDIVKCVSKVRDRAVHRKFEQCENLLHEKGLEELKKCKEESVPKDMEKCYYYSVLFDTPEVAKKIYECVIGKTVRLDEEEKKKVVEFEDCARKLHTETCKIGKIIPF